MPIDNYFNPNSFKPDGGQMFMANGLDFQRDRNRFDLMAELQRQMIQQQLAKEQEEFQEGRPVRQAQRGSQIAGFGLQEMMDRQRMGTPNYGQTMIGGQMGEAQSKQVAGQTAMQTMPGNIEQTNVSNRGKTLADMAQQFQVMSATAGPLQTMQMWKQFRDGAPDHIKQILPETYDASVPKLLSAMHNAVTQTPEHKRDIDKVRVQGEEARKLQELKNAGDLRTAQARQTQKTLDFDQALKKATTSAHIMSIAQQIQNDPDLPADKRDSLMARANAAYQAMVKLEASRADARTPPLKQAIEGGVGDAVANRLEGPPQQPGVAKRHSMSELRRLYPGKSDKQLKEAYKKKFGFDPLP